MIQGEDKLGDGTGGVSLADLKEGNENKEYSIKGEFLANGFKNTLKHEKGVISMARSDYSTLGLAEGEEAPKDENGNTLPSDKPVNPPVMTSVTVETFGVDYGMPKTEEPFDYNEFITQYLTQNYTGE